MQSFHFFSPKLAAPQHWWEIIVFLPWVYNIKPRCPIFVMRLKKICRYLYITVPVSCMHTIEILEIPKIIACGRFTLKLWSMHVIAPLTIAWACLTKNYYIRTCKEYYKILLAPLPFPFCKLAVSYANVSTCFYY